MVCLLNKDAYEQFREAAGGNPNEYGMLWGCNPEEKESLQCCAFAQSGVATGVLFLLQFVSYMWLHRFMVRREAEEWEDEKKRREETGV